MLPSDYAELKQIDTILLCGICYEYLETTVITPCSHNYCSLCIRKYLHYKTQCPACFEEVFEKDLRVNKALDEIKQYFVQLKEKLIKYVQSIPNDRLNLRNNTPSKPQHSKENLIIEKHQDVDNSNVKNFGAKHHVTRDFDESECTLQNTEIALSSPSTSKTSMVSSFFTPRNKKVPEISLNENIVICPVCKVNISEKNINKHLDDCLKREISKDKPIKSKLKRKPLPKLVLSLMKESEIKKKLKELGLSHGGDRKAMEVRLQRYTTIYNAECDKEDPRSTAELIKQCEEEENVEKKVNKLIFPKLQINRNTAENIIEEERRKYLEINKSSFENLISKIKSTEKVQKPSVKHSTFHEVENVEPSENLDSQDSDSSFICPLQMYSSEDPMNFLTVELSYSDDKNDKVNSTVDKEESVTATTDFFYSEMEKPNVVNKRPILFSENPCINDTFTGLTKSRVKKNCSQEKKEICSEIETKSSIREEQSEKNNDFEKTNLDENAFGLSSNDSIIYDSDSEDLENKVCNTNKKAVITDSLFIASKLEKNVKLFKKRCFDNTLSEETNSVKKKQRLKVHTNCLSEKNVPIHNEHQSNIYFNTQEKSKSSTKSQKRKEVSSTCTPPRKSNRLQNKNNYTTLDDTMM